MATKIVNSPGVGATLILQNIRGYANKLRIVLEGKALDNAAKELQRVAFDAMKKQYFSTKVNRKYYSRAYNSKSQRFKLEHVLFSKKSPIKRVSKNTVQVSFLPKPYEELIRLVPHLQWQEEGTRGVVDSQPYIITKGGLRAIKKRVASSFPKARSRKGRIGSVIYLKVPHYPLKPRNFILAADLVIKTQGGKIIRDSVKKTLRSLK